MSIASSSEPHSATAAQPAAPNMPCLLCYHQQSELDYLADEHQLHALQQHGAYLLPDDVLIDSCGQEFKSGPGALWLATGRCWTLAELIPLVQQHFFAKAQSCVVKIQPPDRKTLYAMVAASLDD